MSERPQGHGSGSTATRSVTSVRHQQPRAHLAGRHGAVILVDVLHDAQVVEQVHRALRTFVTVEPLCRGVEVERPHSEGPLEPLAQLRGERLAVREDHLGGHAQAARLLLAGEQPDHRRIAAQVVGLELVEACDELGQRLCGGERKQAVHAHVQGAGAAAAHVRRGGAADQRQAPTRHPWLGAGPVGAAQELREDGPPGGAVVDEHRLASR
ncbi:MAG: hypothetical protein ABWZ63_00965 [Thermoleophilaceae bacterium]